MKHHSAEAEMSVVGSCLLSSIAMEEAASALSPADFFEPDNRRIFAALCSMHSDRMAVDLVTVREWMRLGDEWEDRLLDRLIQSAEYVVSPSNCLTYAGIVKDWSLARASCEAARRVMEAAAEGDAQAIIQAAESLPKAVENTIGGELLSWDDIDATKNETGVTTGYLSLDAYTGGIGFVDGQTTFIAAVTKGGKTTLMCNSCRKLADQGIPVVYATFADLSAEQLKRRMVKQSCGVGGPSPIPERDERFTEELARQHEAWRGVLRIYESSKHGRTVEEFCSKMKSAHRKQPFRCIFVDYAQKIGSRAIPESEKVRTMEHVSDRLKRLAEDLEVAIVVGTQLTPKGDGEYVTKYASAFEQDAGWMLFLKHESGSGKVNVESKLNRFGDQESSVDLVWNEKTTAISEPPISHVPTGGQD